MERARILRWRLEQQAARVQQEEEESRARATARLIRPLMDQPLTRLARELGGTLHNTNDIPGSKIENDRRSVQTVQFVRDHLTTKAFTIDTINGVFLISIADRQVELDLICPHYRHRGEFSGAANQGQWFPPGDYTEVYLIAQAQWQHDDAPVALEQFFTAVQEQIPTIRAYSATAAQRARYRRRMLLRRKITLGLVAGIYIAVVTVLIVWCLTMMYVTVRYGAYGVR
ncbi:MAG: hypothetical protein H0T53_00215 [Herpetosiphonaceae bacterium]|nr:hypothetical protein [Herpetosiphonaceae bacterium]